MCGNFYNSSMKNSKTELKTLFLLLSEKRAEWLLKQINEEEKSAHSISLLPHLMATGVTR